VESQLARIADELERIRQLMEERPTARRRWFVWFMLTFAFLLAWHVIRTG
jgi:hypothetical protein